MFDYLLVKLMLCLVDFYFKRCFKIKKNETFFFQIGLKKYLVVYSLLFFFLHLKEMAIKNWENMQVIPSNRSPYI